MRVWMMMLVMLLLVAPPAFADQVTTADVLIRRGAQLESKHDYDGALEVYSKLEKLDGQRGNALYFQGRIAFLRNQYTMARELTQRAIPFATQPFKTDAKMLYGDVLFATGEYRRAKDFYIALHDQAPRKRAELEKKIIACNQQLKLAERDGL